MKLSDDSKTLLKVNENDIIDGSYQIPAGVTTIGFAAFAECRSLKTIVLPAGIKVIADQAFFGCGGLKTIALPAGIKAIGDWAFSECRSLQTITLPAGIKSIGIGVFDNCSSLQRVALTAGITAITIGAFKGCRSLQTITLPVGIKAIGAGAFSECISLQTIALPAGVKRIGHGIFKGCKKLTYIIIDSNDQAELERTAASLREKFKSKVVSKSLYTEVFRIQDKQLARILFSPKTNPIYRFFHVDTRHVTKVNVENEEQQTIKKSRSTLPEEMFCHINIQAADANLYYQKAKVLIEREPWPKTLEELQKYKARLINIVSKCIKQAERFNAAPEETQTASPATSFN
ncbi:Uncharacterised protein [Legionella beliardensis]|uniref:Bacterial surface protein 26-residue repeat n=1 Tax=Legionella beliardensis TaxID=91822 RepID=A0A378HYE1_9GAMM|nr:leucine-rich repeat domain-containing protein [Legionella beliardensis]STX27909.1 Uncharacterised protein [Legionella beliardensis]